MALSKHTPVFWDQIKEVRDKYPPNHKFNVSYEPPEIINTDIRVYGSAATNDNNTVVYRIVDHGIINAIRFRSRADKKELVKVTIKDALGDIDAIYGDVYDVLSTLYETDELTIPFHLLNGQNMLKCGEHTRMSIEFKFKTSGIMAGLELEFVETTTDIVPNVSYLQCYDNRELERDKYTTYTRDKKVVVFMRRPLSYLIIKKDTEKFYSNVTLRVKDDLVATYKLDQCTVSGTNCYLLPLTPSIKERYDYSINLSKDGLKYDDVVLHFSGEYEPDSCPVKVYGLTMQLMLQSNGVFINRFSC